MHKTMHHIPSNKLWKVSSSNEKCKLGAVRQKVPIWCEDSGVITANYHWCTVHSFRTSIPLLKTARLWAKKEKPDTFSDCVKRPFARFLCRHWCTTATKQLLVPSFFCNSKGIKWKDHNMEWDSHRTSSLHHLVACGTGTRPGDSDPSWSPISYLKFGSSAGEIFADPKYRTLQKELFFFFAPGSQWPQAQKAQNLQPSTHEFLQKLSSDDST